MSQHQFDLIVIGGGPGGYVAAIRASQNGLKTACVEKYSTLGGTCLNVGCIPSKALLDSSELYHLANEKFKVHGIDVSGLSLNWKQMLSRKDKVISDTCKGIDYLFGKNKVTRLSGHASFVDPHTLKIDKADGTSETVTAAKFIIATGSKPVELPFLKYDDKFVISSSGALKLEKVPEHLIVIGGGVIGLELGSVYGRLGSKITVIEFMDNIIPTMDLELGKELQKTLKKIGFTFHLGTKVKSGLVEGGKITITAEDKSGKEVVVTGDHALVSVGRRPFTDGLNLAALGIETERGFIKTDEHLRTVHQHIYAVGDVRGGAMLAHKAEEEGVFAADDAAGKWGHINYNTIPGVVYTWPEVAAVGQTEEQLKAAGIAYKVGKFPFKASGRARAAEEADGFCKVLADETTDEILGVHLIGPRCADIIAEAVVAMEYRASAEDIARICHAHPTFTEPLKEAAMAAFDKRPIHI